MTREEAIKRIKRLPPEAIADALLKYRLIAGAQELIHRAEHDFVVRLSEEMELLIAQIKAEDNFQKTIKLTNRFNSLKRKIEPIANDWRADK